MESKRYEVIIKKVEKHVAKQQETLDMYLIGFTRLNTRKGVLLLIDKK